MTVTDIRIILESPYNRKIWKSFIQTQFTNNNLLVNDAPLNLGKSDLYTDCYSLGNYAIDDYTKIGIFEIQLADKVNLTRNRVALRNLIKDITKQVAGAMVVFVQGDKWRFSYISKRKIRNKETNTVEDKETAPKRYTYLFGKGEKALTASIRFERLIQKQQGNLYQFLTLNDFEEAFSVEKLSKEFFDKYKEIYQDIIEFITGKRFVKKGSKWIETGELKKEGPIKDLFHNNEKEARDFVKRMMGRIVFLYFIQKKGWLAVEKGKNWGEGNFDYLQNLYNESEYKNSFYEKVLVPLFFNTLNNEDSENPNNEFRFPYLNGGLFDDAHDKIYNSLVLPEQYLKNLFNTFNEYNFTIYEDAPDEHTVAVDPEMLGHIFENLLEDNKDKGAFYTPKDIVHYMCRESLHNYIYTYTGNEENDNFKTKLKLYNENYDINIFSNNEVKLIDRALEDVKICDPAIGSGAFPMGLLHEIYNLKLPIEDKNGNKAKSPAAIKKHIIEESIYGVDIDSGAVDIARLRFWLSLVVDETEPQPLPNLDFKIVCANTLIPTGYDNFVKLAEKTQTPTLLRMDGEIQKLQQIRDDYFKESHKKDKEALQKQFVDNRNYILNEFNSLRKTWNLGNFIDKIAEWQPFEDTSCTWFDAWWMFGVKDGFDIVIGNPPYVEVSKKEDKLYFKNNYDEYLSGHYDLYIFFFKKGIDLLKVDGILSFITPHTFLHYSQFASLRSKLLELKIIKLTEKISAVFENAVVDTAITILQNKKQEDYNIEILSIQYEQGKLEFVNSATLSNKEITSDTFDLNAIRKKVSLIYSQKIQKDWVI